MQPLCQICQLNRKVVRGNGNITSKYLVVLDYPTSGDFSHNLLLDGMAGRLLKAIFKSHGVDESDIYCSSLLMCRPPDKQEPTKVQFNACKARWEHEISKVNYEKILVLGTNACQFLFGKKLFSMRAMPFEFMGKPTVCSYSPAYILHNPEIFLDIWEDIRKLVKPELYPTYDYGEISKFQILTNTHDICQVLEKVLPERKKLGFDIETKPRNPFEKETALNPKKGILRCLGIGDEKDAFIFDAELFNPAVKRALSWLSRRVDIIAHHADMEYRWMMQHECDIRIKRDTLLKHHEIDERQRIPRSLKWLGKRYFNIPDWSEILHTDESTDVTDWINVPNDKLYPYLAHDVKVTTMLDTFFDEHPECPPKELFDMIMEGRRVLSSMTHFGAPIDKQYLFLLTFIINDQVETTIEYLEKSLDREDINPRSPKVISDILFEQLGLDRIDGNSTGKKVLADLKHLYPEETIIGKIQEARNLLTVQSGFVKKLYQLGGETGYIHGQFTQSVAATGRLSGVDPNLQNIPVRGEKYTWQFDIRDENNDGITITEGSKKIGDIIRNAFILPPGYDYFVSADYSQIEVFIAAVISGDQALINLLANGGDIYTYIASEFQGIPIHEVTDELRQDFKPVVLGTLFDRQADAIARQLHTDPAVEKARQETFFRLFPDYKTYMHGLWSEGKRGKGQCLREGALEVVKRQRYVQSLYGRKRHFWTTFNESDVRRKAINAPIQGTASDINFESLIRNYCRAEREGILHLFRPWNIIHDSQEVWIAEEFKPKVKQYMKDTMLNPSIELPLKLRVEFKIGKRWGEMRKWNDD